MYIYSLHPWRALCIILTDDDPDDGEVAEEGDEDHEGEGEVPEAADKGRHAAAHLLGAQPLQAAHLGRQGGKFRNVLYVFNVFYGNTVLS